MKKLLTFIAAGAIATLGATTASAKDYYGLIEGPLDRENDYVEFCNYDFDGTVGVLVDELDEELQINMGECDRVYSTSAWWEIEYDASTESGYQSKRVYVQWPNDVIFFYNGSTGDYDFITHEFVNPFDSSHNIDIELNDALFHPEPSHHEPGYNTNGRVQYRLEI